MILNRKMIERIKLMITESFNLAWSIRYKAMALTIIVALICIFIAEYFEKKQLKN